MKRIPMMAAFAATLLAGSLAWAGDVKNVSWQESKKYSRGVDPAIAVSNDVAVEIHKTQANETKLFYRVGTPDDNGITWGEDYKFEDEGINPTVAVNAKGQVVEIHKGGYASLLYRVGVVDAATRKISWGPRRSFDTGLVPSVALNDDGVVVEVHHCPEDDMAAGLTFGLTLKNDLWYHVGVIDMDEKKIKWGDSHKYDKGDYDNGVAINNNNMVVEVHKSQNSDGLWYRVGKVNLSKKTISWGDSDQYDNGVTPEVTLDDAGHVVEVHKSYAHQEIWSHAGQLKDDAKKVSWSSSKKYDDGMTPDVALNNKNEIIEVHKSENEDTLWYHRGAVP